MSRPIEPIFSLYVVWHPDFADGAAMAEALREHFRRKLFENVAGGAGVSVFFRSTLPPGGSTPLPIDLGDAQTTAIVVLTEEKLISDPAWIGYVRDIAKATDAFGFGARLFPISLTSSVMGALGIAEQALRWDDWKETDAEKARRLCTELTYEFCRMLRHHLERLRRPATPDEELERYLVPVRVFISHSKHDGDGQRLARIIRKDLHDSHGIQPFFDAYDIPGGVKFDDVLLLQVRASAIVAVHTDSYSTREWCRREIIEAKRHHRPLVIANAITDRDERGFPYLGNVPIVRVEPAALSGDARIYAVIARLLDEVMKDFLWQCRVEMHRGAAPDVTFWPRPPELIALATLSAAKPGPASIVVYPDPPLSTEEERLFAEVAPRLQLRSLTEWIAGAVR